MKRKGQALVEFIIILPVILLLIFGIIDFSRIVSEKNKLENISFDAVTMFKNGKGKEEIQALINENEDKDVTLTITDKDTYWILTFEKRIEPVTPGINKILKDTFNISTKRVVYDE